MYRSVRGFIVPIPCMVPLPPMIASRWSVWYWMRVVYPACLRKVVVSMAAVVRGRMRRVRRRIKRDIKMRIGG